MPWTVKDARQKNPRIRSDGEARMWVRVANRALRAELKGNPREEAEERSIEAANGALKEMRRKGGAGKFARDLGDVLLQWMLKPTKPASHTKPLILYAPGTTSFVSLDSKPIRLGGTPIHRYRKEVIRIGDYVHPDTGQKFSVTPKTLAHWAATFARMRENGVGVTVPLKHENEDNPEKTLGNVDELLVDGDALVGIFSLIGDDAPRIAESNDVSLFVPPEFTDARGNVYKHPIRHIAITPVPVIPGLKKWESLAAAYTLTQEPSTMAFDWKKLGTDLELKAELTEETAPELLLAHVGDLKKQVAEVGKKKPDPAPATADPPVVDPTLLSLASENRRMKLDALVEAARITPAVRDKLAAQYVDAEPLALSLSRGGDNFDALVNALAENDPVELGEKSGPQTLRLSRGDAGETQKLIDKQIERSKQQLGS